MDMDNLSLPYSRILYDKMKYLLFKVYSFHILTKNLINHSNSNLPNLKLNLNDEFQEHIVKIY